MREGSGKQRPRFPFAEAAEGSDYRKDPLRRFTRTPYAMNLQLMQRTVRIETNSQAVLELAHRFFERHQHGNPGEPEFVWRLVSEPDSGVNSTAVHLSAFSDLGVRFVNIGQRGFIAVDVENRKAIGFLGELFFEADARLRHRPPLDILFCMTAASLRLTAL